MSHRPNRDLKKRSRGPEKRRDGSREFWDGIGVDVESMGPRAQVVTSLAVLIPIALGLVAVFAFAPYVWWLVFVFGWMVFPALGLLVRGIAGLSEGERGARKLSGDEGERELLAALQRRGELTSAQAAMETSLSVAEADEMLKKLAEGGHLDVRVRGGGLFYALWDHERDELEEG